VQFEGWPALQFSGWPSVAIGTFAGRVSFVDATDNGAGQFRIVVVPEPGTDWPAPVYLRQGVRAQGWVQLGKVKLGFELWRQFNGFPQSLPEDPGKAKGKSMGTGKDADKDKGGK
jgi:membrane fusion protein, adhesin transport system